MDIYPSVFFRNCSCLAALVVLVYDHVITFRFEYNCIWKRSLTPVKFVYIFCRYSSLICQIVNAALLFTKLYRAPIDPLLCRQWTRFLITTCTVQGTMMHSIVMLRVYALHRKDLKIGILLFILLIAMAGSTLYTWWFPHHDDVCNLKHATSSMLPYRIWMIAVETIILTLTIAKMNVAAQYANIAEKVVRDGGGFFALMTVALILPSVQAVGAAITSFSFIWMLTISPVMTCRLIRGFLQMDEDASLDQCSRVSDNDVELTSFIDVAG
ncbi:hypothetical protein BDQ17DRAFT_854153 [Cyathus striatus]|nr:hypothetical protein BDQ17DRAFT_854153 [Cyathus striatus]